MKHFLVFGNHPFLSLAEAKAFIGGEKPLIAGKMAIFDREEWNAGKLQASLGGTVKLGDIMDELDIKDLTALRLAEVIEAMPRAEEHKKIEFGITLYGASPEDARRFKGLPLQLKRALQDFGHPVRWVTGDRGEVTPAAVAKAHLTTEGFDLVLGFFDKKVFIGLSTHVQNADAWSLRDYGRPFRDEVAGMLPPKLARLMVNLGLSQVTSDKLQVTTLLDPFCGGGTVLMEAAIAGVGSLIGSDLSVDQIKGCEQNFAWLAAQNIVRTPLATVVSDVREVNKHVEAADVIVTEGHLGRPLTGQETLKTLEDQKKEIEKIWIEALVSFAKIQPAGSRLVCVWPVFVSSHGTIAVDLKTKVQDLGYRLVDPLDGWAKPLTLTYARPEQKVRRNIVVMERI
ncbi:MAG: hypothetical protein Q7R83_01570 [bacterium]|nr:hypothetical protein [bacterium]